MRGMLGLVGSGALAWVLVLPSPASALPGSRDVKQRVNPITGRASRGPAAPGALPSGHNSNKPPQRKTGTNGPIKSIGVTVQVQPAQPTVFDLGPMFPNPPVGQATIPFSLATPTLVTIKVYNVMGQQVANVMREFHGPGQGSVVWDLRDDQGRRCRAGIYFVRMNAGSYQRTRKITIR